MGRAIGSIVGIWYRVNRQIVEREVPRVANNAMSLSRNINKIETKAVLHSKNTLQ